MRKIILTAVTFVFMILPAYSVTADEYAGQAAAKAKDKNYKGAVADYNSAIKADPKNAGYYSEKAFIELINLHDYKQAHKDIETAISLDPQNNDYKQIRILTREGVNNPKGMDAMLKAKDAMDNGKYPESLTAINEAIKSNPSFALYYAMRGFARDSNKEDPALVLADYDKAIALDKDNMKGEVESARNDILNKWNGTVQDKISAKDYTVALLDINKLIDTAPDFADFYITRATIYKYLKQYNNAIADIDRAVAVAPDRAEYKGYRIELGEAKAHPDAYGYFAASQEKWVTGDFAGIVADTTNAIKLSPDFADYYVVRAIAKNKLKDYKGALADMEKAVSIDPDNKTKVFNRDGLMNSIKKNITK